MFAYILILMYVFDIILKGISNSWVIPLFIMNGGDINEHERHFIFYLDIISSYHHNYVNITTYSNINIKNHLTSFS